MRLLPRLFRGYRGNFPAAPVESAPMYVIAANVRSTVVYSSRLLDFLQHKCFIETYGYEYITQEKMHGKAVSEKQSNN